MRNRPIVPCLLVAMLLLLVGCGNSPQTHEEAFEQFTEAQIAHQKELLAILKSVDDMSSAEVAERRFDAVLKKIEASAERLISNIRALGEPAEEDKDRIEEKVDAIFARMFEELEPITREFFEEGQRLATVPELAMWTQTTLLSFGERVEQAMAEVFLDAEEEFGDWFD